METQNVFASTRSQVRDEEGNFLFRKEWLENYIVIPGPGTYEAVVTSTPFLYIPADYGEEGNPRHIVNVKAVLESNLPALQELLKGKEFVKADDLRGLFLNASVWGADPGQDAPTIPHKRQRVDINVNPVVDKMTGEEVLRITDIFVAKPLQAKKVDMKALFAEDIALPEG
jgi:hypothetical protein